MELLLFVLVNLGMVVLILGLVLCLICIIYAFIVAWEYLKDLWR